MIVWVMSKERVLKMVIMVGRNMSGGVDEGETLQDLIPWSCKSFPAVKGGAACEQEEEVKYICGAQPHLLMCREDWGKVECCVVGTAWLEGLM